MAVAIGGITAWVVASSDSGPPDSSAPAHSRAGPCRTQVAPGPATIGADAPTFVLRGLDGGCIDLAALRGRPVMVNFWASWCNPCRREFPLLRRALAQHAAQNLELVAVVFEDIDDDARRFAAEFGADWSLPFDDNGAVAEAYGVSAIPQTFFVRRDGTIASRVFGITTGRELERELRAILP